MADFSLSSRILSPQRKQSNFIRFLAYARRYKHYIAIAAVGGIVKFGVPLLIPQITRHLVDEVYLNPALTSAEKTRELLTIVGVMMAAFVLIWAPLTFARHYFAGKAGQKSIFDLRSDLYYRILRMSASFFDRNQSGSIVARLISDIQQAQNLVGSALTNIWMDLISLLLILYFMLTIDAAVTLVALATFPAYIYLFRKLRDEIRSSSHAVQEEIAAMSGNVSEKIVGNQVVRAFTQEKAEERNFYNDSFRVFSSSMRRVYFQSLNMTLTGVIVQLAPLLVMLYGGYRVINESLTVGDLVAIGLYLGPLYTPLQRFAELNIVFANSMAALDRVFEIMDEKPEIRDRPGAVDLEQVAGRVTFEGVYFAYPGDDPRAGAALRDIDLDVLPGQKVALVGPSGAGKSTIASLIPRFYDASAGRVLIDGHDIRRLKLRSLRRHIGMVLQDPILFSGSVLENIRYGRPQADEEEIIAACKAANAYDFIMRLPRGLHSEVGENGAFLSGGQRQRLTIARAFLKDPRILILDEATSALDSESEKLIQAALERLMEGRATFIIAHRLSTIENADLILVMRDGRIVERGAHRELLSREDGLYRRLYSPA